MLVSPAIVSSTPTNAATGFPGQPGNPVGFAAAPTFTGALTTFSGSLVSGTESSHQQYVGFDFNAGTGGTLISSLEYIDFIGCRFQSNQTENYNSQITGSANITFTYCSFTPLASLYTSPPGSAWPSAGAWPATPTITFDTNVNCINGNDGYQYGCQIFSTGPVSFTSCDFWGFGNIAIGFFGTTEPMTVTNCWIHDAANSSPNGYHTDGLGYLNGGAGPSNVTITGCTIASIGNTNAIAFQSQTSGYSGMVMSGNYLSGYGYIALLSQAGNMTTTTFTNNTFGTDVPAIWGPLYLDYTTMFSGSGNLYSGNTIHVVSGTSPWSSADWSFTSADDGKFLWPDTTLHSTDF